LWSGSRLALTRRREPLICFGATDDSSGVESFLQQELLASEELPHARPVQTDLFRYLAEREPGLLRPLEACETFCVGLAELPVEIGLSAPQVFAGFSLGSIHSCEHPRS